MALEIRYESEDFAAGTSITNGTGALATTWDDLLWAAITVGRPNRQYVFRHGLASNYEALFRLSLIRMALEQKSPKRKRLYRTAAARTLDPTEKGAINYFLGLAVCKLFASELLKIPWMLHLDVFRPQLNPVLSGRSRPDLVGQMVGGGWIALECKGRLSPPSLETKNKAKEQAQRLIRVNGAPPTLQIGGIVYFKNDELQFFWRDPELNPNVRNPISVEATPDIWRHYYAPILELIESIPGQIDQMQHEPILVPIKQADIQLGIHPHVLTAIRQSRWQDTREIAQTNYEGLNLGYRPDGITLHAGESWERRFTEIDQQEE